MAWNRSSRTMTLPFLFTEPGRARRGHRRAGGVVSALLLALALALAAGPARAQATAEALRQRLEGGLSPDLARRSLDVATLRRFYQARDFRPAWTGDPAAVANAALACAALDRASEEGLDPADYHARALAAATAPTTAQAAATRELLLTDGFLRYAHDLRLGRVAPNAVDDDVALPARQFDPVAALQAALANGRLAKLIAELPPADPGYAPLKTALARYRDLVAHGGWPQIPPGPELKLGSTDPRLGILRQRLAAEDRALAADVEQARPGDLAAALRRYQLRNGLEPDGRIGKRTLAMLNASAPERVAQIAANLERLRWLPRAHEARRIVVNVAAGELRAINDGRTVLVSRVIIGDARHPTPMLGAVATGITVNPPWNVPMSIARKEMLPKLRRNPRYLLDENIVLVNGPADDPFGLRVDWRSIPAGRFPYRLRQLPGPGNSLGGLKLEMPNRFDVYLHDTPVKRLFARAERAFSHGCVRVEQALALASWVLSGDPTGLRDRLKSEIAAGGTHHVRLEHPLPVYLLYGTAFVEADGTIAFRADIYGRDRRLIAALADARKRESEAQIRPGIAPTPHKG
jgi:murein L,D-transpeptidase YcbB/YkuD